MYPSSRSYGYGYGRHADPHGYDGGSYRRGYRGTSYEEGYSGGYSSDYGSESDEGCGRGGESDYDFDRHGHRLGRRASYEDDSDSNVSSESEGSYPGTDSEFWSWAEGRGEGMRDHGGMGIEMGMGGSYGRGGTEQN
ncbi:hypothetical protein MMC06_000227 [Schaereria dolodes]|nr:hypothetical protein [Schaereria dolodes]